MLSNKKVPVRRCVACGEMKEKQIMHRVIKVVKSDTSLEHKEYTFAYDSNLKGNGRGAYICKNAACVEKAIKTRGLDRSLKTRVPEEMYQEVQKEMSYIEK